MVLISEDEYNRRREVAPGSTETEQKSIDEKSIDQIQKLHAYELQEAIDKGQEMAAASARPPPLSVSFIKAAIDKFPLYARQRAHQIFNKVLAENVSWNSEGTEISLPNNPEISLPPNSNILDLIYFASIGNKKVNMMPPVGWEEISQILNMPKSVVSKKKTVRQPSRRNKQSAETVQPSSSKRRKTAHTSPPAESEIFTDAYQYL